MNEPGPDYLEVFELESVGLTEVFQQIPRCVIGDSPSDVTFPPEVAVVEAIDETAVVATNGNTWPSPFKQRTEKPAFGRILNLPTVLRPEPRERNHATSETGDQK